MLFNFCLNCSIINKLCFVIKVHLDLIRNINLAKIIMDLFQLALQGKTPVMYEYFLVGSVLDSAKDGFIEILRGLCDNPENRPIEFLESENIYSASNYFFVFVNYKNMR